MVLSSPIYKLFNKYRLPLNRYDEDIYTFLQHHFEEYEKEISTLTNLISEDTIFPKSIYFELVHQQDKIKELCSSILKSIKAYLNGNTLVSNKILFQILNKLQDEFSSFDIKEFSNYPYDGCLYRIRSYKKDGTDYTKKELFHPPFSEVSRIKAYRYSIAGYPCLYLGSDVNLCWVESGMPSKFAYAKFIYSNEKPFPLLDLRRSPNSIIRNLMSINCNQNCNEIVCENIKRLFITYPLIAACSISVQDKEKNFIVEYIIPQILLTWIRQQDKFRGIAYFSSSINEKAKIMNSHNVVIPPNRNGNQDYGEELTRVFKLTNPTSLNLLQIYQSEENQNLQKSILFLKNESYKLYTQGNFSGSPLRLLFDNLDSLLLIMKKTTEEQCSSYFEIERFLSIIMANIRFLVEYPNHFLEIITNENKGPNQNSKEEWEKYLLDYDKIIDEINTVILELPLPSHVVYKNIACNSAEQFFYINE